MQPSAGQCRSFDCGLDPAEKRLITGLVVALGALHVRGGTSDGDVALLLFVRD